MKSYKESLNDLLNSSDKWDRVERIPLISALNRVNAADVIALKDYPEFKTASMDGYAIKFKDISSERIKIIGQKPAGDNTEFDIEDLECVQTFTGSLICSSADTLIPIENVEVENGFIRIIKKVAKGFAIRKVGESYEKGDILVKKGARLGYSELGLLAELGQGYINVFVRPKVAVLSTGSEIVDIGEIRQNKAEIYGSNSVTILSMLTLLNCEVLILPVVKDDINLIKDSIEKALSSCDFLVTTGGVSVGDFDFVKEIIKGFELVVNKAAIKPGRHIKIAKLGQKYIFSLPGFPYSTMVAMALYFREFINKILYLDENYRFKAYLAEDYVKKSDLEEFSAASIENINGKIFISTSTKKSGSSAIVSNLNNKAVLLNCPAEKNELRKGDLVEYIVML